MYEAIELRMTREPARVIASSTSPFDKFPLVRQRSTGNYSYLGLRGLGSFNFGFAILNRTLGSLIRAIGRDPDKAVAVADVLGYLGYADGLEATLVSQTNLIRQLASASNATDAWEHLYRLRTRSIPLSEAGVTEKQLRDALQVAAEWDGTRRLKVRIARDGVHETNTGRALAPNFPLLIELGLMQLKEISLSKLGVNSTFSINQASSGEQSVVTSLLGMAGEMQDNSLICIDEPEICLHPQWQERYIELLMTTFGRFKGCHFVIATHSPQIVANLREENCHILDLVSGETSAASSFTRRSADFQLAELFKAPGYKNEYLSRELVAALSQLGTGSLPTSERLLELERLADIGKLLHSDDPLAKLAELLQKSLGVIRQ